MKKAYTVICNRASEGIKCKKCFHSKAHEKEYNYYNPSESCSSWTDCDWLEIEKAKKNKKVRCERLPNLAGK